MTGPEVTPERVIRTYLVLVATSTLSASLIWGVNTLFLLHAGLDIAEVFVANAAYTLGMVLFEVPTGVVADTLGRRTSFLLSMLVLCGSTIAYVLVAAGGGTLLPFVLASVGLGLGYTFSSGATEAWLVDALVATGAPRDLSPVFSRGQAVTNGTIVVGTIGGGLLGSIDLAVPFVVRAALLLVTFGVAFALMHDLGFAGRPLTRHTLAREVAGVARASVEHGLGRPVVRLLMGVSFFQAGFFVWAWYAWQPYFLDLLGRDEIWISGLISAAIAVAMIGGNRLVGPLSAWTGRRTTILVGAAIVESLAAVGVGLVDGFPLALGALMLFGAAAGVRGPVKQAFLHDSIPSEQRATIVSFDSLVGNLGSVGGQVGLGVVARDRGIPEGYVFGGAAIALAVPLLVLLRRLGAPADRIPTPE